MFSEKTTFHLYFWQSQLFYHWRQVKKSRANNKWLHIAMRLLSNRSKITSKCGENNKKKKLSDTRAAGEWRVTSFVIARQHRIYSLVARDVIKNQTKKLSILLSFYFHEVLHYLNTFT